MELREQIGENNWRVDAGGAVWRNEQIIINNAGVTAARSLNRETTETAFGLRERWERWRKHHRPQRVERSENSATLKFLNHDGEWEIVRDEGLAGSLPWEHPYIADGLRAKPNLDAGHRELLRVYDMGRLPPEVYPVEHCEPHPFTWEEASRTMLAGGECEYENGGYWVRCRHYAGHYQYWSVTNGIWGMIGIPAHLRSLQWRPCAGPNLHIWQDALKSLLRGQHCWSRPDKGARWTRCRIKGGTREFQRVDGTWDLCPDSARWHTFEWSLTQPEGAS